MIVKTAHGAASIAQKSLPFAEVMHERLGYLRTNFQSIDEVKEFVIVRDCFSNGVLIPLSEARSQSEEKIRQNLYTEIIKNLEIPLNQKTTFRVSCERNSDFISTKSAEIEKELGSEIVARYQAPASMKDFDVEVYLEIFQDLAFCGIKINKLPVDRWFSRLYNPGGALQNHIAGLMIEVADLKKRERVLDICAGSGTIGINLLRKFPDLELVNNDIRPSKLNRSSQNYESAKIKIPELLYHDLTEKNIFEDVPAFDVIFGNTPFGVKISAGNESFHTFYRKMLENIASILKADGCAVLLIFRQRSFEVELKKQKHLQKVSKHQIFAGGLGLYLYRLNKISN